MFKIPEKACSPYREPPSGSRHHSNQGGQNAANVGHCRAIRVIRRAFGSVFHRLLVFQLPFPTTFTACTTSYHFVPHLSCKSFIVKKKLDGALPTWAVIL